MKKSNERLIIAASNGNGNKRTNRKTTKIGNRNGMKSNCTARLHTRTEHDQERKT